MKKIQFLIGVLLIVVIAVFLFNGRVLATSIHLESSQGEEIRLVIERAYQILESASKTFDPVEFPEVFIDTPDCRPGPEEIAIITMTLGKEAADKAGYLTMLQVKYLVFKTGREQLDALEARAKTEKREVTAEEYQDFLRSNYGVMPPARMPEEVLFMETKISLQSIESTLDQQKAVVRFENGRDLMEATLVRVNGRWYISNIKPIEVRW